MNILEMPDRMAESLLSFIRLNEGRLGRKLFEGEFEKLTDDARAEPWRARAPGGLRHGTGGGTGTETADELTRVNNHRPSIFWASPSRSTWLLAVQFGRPVAAFNDTSK